MCFSPGRRRSGVVGGISAGQSIPFTNEVNEKGLARFAVVTLFHIIRTQTHIHLGYTGNTRDWLRRQTAGVHSLRAMSRGVSDLRRHRK